MTTQATRGRPHVSTRASSSSFTQSLCSPSQGMQRLPTFKNTTCPFPWMGLPSPKYQHQSLFILNETAVTPGSSPRACTTWSMGSVPGHRMGFVLEISNTTRRCEHALLTVSVAYYHQQTPNQKPDSQEQPLGYLRMWKAGWESQARRQRPLNLCWIYQS